MSDRRWVAVRHYLNWCNATTPLGLLVARLTGATVRRGPRYLYFADGQRASFIKARAFTIGNVILSAAPMPSLQERTPRILQHEERHCDQYAYWGLALLPAYFACTGISWILTGDRARFNPFERSAGLADGGYRA